MSSALRAQVALIGLLACLLIPVSTSSLRGLTHVLTCKHAVDTPVAISVDDQGRATSSVASVIERGADGDTVSREVCGGLTVEVAVDAAQPEPSQAAVTVAIANQSDYGWRGSVQLDMNGVEIPIDIGAIDAGETAQDQFTLHLDRGQSYEITGNLLIGP